MCEIDFGVMQKLFKPRGLKLYKKGLRVNIPLGPCTHSVVARYICAPLLQPLLLTLALETGERKERWGEEQ